MNKYVMMLVVSAMLAVGAGVAQAKTLAGRDWRTANRREQPPPVAVQPESKNPTEGNPLTPDQFASLDDMSVSKMVELPEAVPALPLPVVETVPAPSLEALRQWKQRNWTATIKDVSHSNPLECRNPYVVERSLATIPFQNKIAPGKFAGDFSTVIFEADDYGRVIITTLHNGCHPMFTTDGDHNHVINWKGVTCYRRSGSGSFMSISKKEAEKIKIRSRFETALKTSMQLAKACTETP
ncbi:MAG: hypothetical protein LBJ69_00400 [Holosporales bacterium]|jgi:hypothetical protein|nr:hypothetical protein [Holosporales bacterium]